jgi:putative ABC transport system ATP-binding protein
MISLSGITKTYRRKGEPPLAVLRGLDLTVGKGDFVAVVGGSGTGKSTLMNILGLLDRPDDGTYQFGDEDVTAFDDTRRTRLRNRTIGFVFQQFHLLPRTTAVDNVRLPLAYGPWDEPKRRAIEALCRVGLQDRLSHTSEQLSGGQQQRVAIARALVTNPAFLLADEPTGNLDVATSGEILDLFDTLNAAGTTILLITHDAEVARRAKRTLVLRDGHLQDEGTPRC